MFGGPILSMSLKLNTLYEAISPVQKPSEVPQVEVADVANVANGAGPEPRSGIPPR